MGNCRQAESGRGKHKIAGDVAHHQCGDSVHVVLLITGFTRGAANAGYVGIRILRTNLGDATDFLVKNRTCGNANTSN
jgi:hypothetical protein